MPTGRGPVNYNYTGSSPQGFNNEIRYQDMVENSRVTQYNQMMMTQRQQMAAQRNAQVMSRAHGQGGGDELSQRLYQRQAVMQQAAHTGGTMGSIAGIGAWAAADATIGAGIGAIGTAAGATGAAALGVSAAAIAVPAAVALYAGNQMNKGVEQELTRRKMTAQTAMDFDVYRNKLGFTRPMSYQQSTQAGGEVSRMYDQGKGSFFGKDEMQRIHKMGMSGGMLDARGGGASSGSLSQYKKNFQDLVDTTEEVVKTLKTTIEGGMSVMKELKQAGFQNSQIKSQIKQVAAVSGATGMSSQNVMSLGHAGAAAVQGTQWRADVGATMYQQGAAQAQSLTTSASGAYAVRRAGGVAQAGAVLANAQMNFFQSGYGTKISAYAMNADGSVNEERLGKVMSGKAGAYDVITGANQNAYDMGPSGRAMFDMYKEDFGNALSDDQRSGLMKKGFNMWGQGRHGNTKAKAWVFAGQFAGNARDRRLLYENLLQPTGFNQLGAVSMAQEGARGAIGGRVQLNTWQQAGRNFTEGFKPMNEGLQGFGRDAMLWGESAKKNVSEFFMGTEESRDITGGFWGNARRAWGGNRTTANRTTRMVSTEDAMMRMSGASMAGGALQGLDIIARREAEGKAGLTNARMYQYDETSARANLEKLGYGNDMSLEKKNALVAALITSNQSGTSPTELMAGRAAGETSGFMWATGLNANDATKEMLQGIGQKGVANMVTAIANDQTAAISQQSSLQTSYDTRREGMTVGERSQTNNRANLLARSFNRFNQGRIEGGKDSVTFARFQELAGGVRGQPGLGATYNKDLIASATEGSALRQAMELEEAKGASGAYGTLAINANRVDREGVSQELEDAVGMTARSGGYGRRANRRARKFNREFERDFNVDLSSASGRERIAAMAWDHENNPSALSDTDIQALNTYKNQAIEGSRGSAISDLAKNHESRTVSEAQGAMEARANGFKQQHKEGLVASHGEDAVDKFFDGRFTAVMSGSMTPEAFTTFKTENKSIIQGLVPGADMSTMTRADLRQNLGLTQRGASDYSATENENAVKTVKMMQIQAAIASKIGSEEGSAGTLTVKDGEVTVQDFTSIQTAQAEVDKLKKEIEGSTQEPSTGGQRDVTLNPPVVSYWNNRWSV